MQKMQKRRSDYIMVKSWTYWFKINSLLMGKCKSDKCDDCNVPENVEHIITGCKNDNSERRILQDKIYALEQ